MSKNTGPIIYRLLPALCVLSAFAGIALLYLFGPRELYIAILEHSGFNPYKFPFLDFHGSLAAWECARQGIDVVVSDPCDELRRPYNYGPIWLAFSFIPLGTADRAWAGLILGLCFIASLTFVPAVKKPWELALIVVASLSTMMVLALERGNPDMMVFMLALAVANLALGPLLSRLLAYLLVLFGGFFKYYPIAMLALTVKERIGLFLMINFAMVGLSILYVVIYHSEITRGFPLIAGGSYFDIFFGAKNLPLGLMVLAPRWAPAALGATGTSIVIYAVLCAITAALSWTIVRHTELADTLSNIDERDRIVLVTGCLLMAGCFFAAQNIAYRGIFFLLTLPGFLAVARNARTRLVSRVMVLASGVTVFLMWGECWHFFVKRIAALTLEKNAAQTIHSVFWLGRELLWWGLMSLMLAILFAFLVRSEVGLRLAGAFGARPRT